MLARWHLPGSACLSQSSSHHAFRTGSSKLSVRSGHARDDQPSFASQRRCATPIAPPSYVDNRHYHMQESRQFRACILSVPDRDEQPVLYSGFGFCKDQALNDAESK